MARHNNRAFFVFPPWTNYLLPVLLILGGGAVTYLPVAIGLGGSARTLNVGYAPKQPVQFSHAMHAGDLGIDCRYCHTTVERASFAAIPPTQICMNCHANILPDSPKMLPVKQSAVSGDPIPWVKVHDLPDYVYFDHSAHVSRGVGCVSCHGRIDRMDVVHQAEPLSMSWCLDCHRDPSPHLRPLDEVTNMKWRPSGSPREMPSHLNSDRAYIEVYTSSLNGGSADAGSSQVSMDKAWLPLHSTAYMTSCYICHR